MDEVTRTRSEYEAARTAWQTAEAQMRANRKASGALHYSETDRKAVDRLHKVLNKASQAYHKARFDAGLIQAA